MSFDDEGGALEAVEPFDGGAEAIFFCVVDIEGEALLAVVGGAVDGAECEDGAELVGGLGGEEGECGADAVAG